MKLKNMVVDRETYDDDVEFLNSYVNEILSEVHRFDDGVYKFRRKTFESMHVSVMRRVLKRVAYRLVGYRGDGYLLHTKLKVLLGNLEFSNYLEIGNGLYVVIEKDHFYVLNRFNVGNVCKFNSYFIGEGGVVVDDIFVSGRGVDFSKVECRTLRDNDRFKGSEIDENMFHALGVSFVFKEYVSALVEGNDVLAFRVFDELYY